MRLLSHSLTREHKGNLVAGRYKVIYRFQHIDDHYTVYIKNVCSCKLAEQPALLSNNWVLNNVIDLIKRGLKNVYAH